MANYDVPADDLNDAIGDSDNLDDGTKDAISDVLDNNADEDGNVVVVTVTSADDLEDIDQDADVIAIDASLITDENADLLSEVPILVIQGDTDTVLDLVAPEAGDSRVVVAGEGNDVFNFLAMLDPSAAGGGVGRDGLVSAQDGHLDGDITIDLAGGNDSVETASGNDSITGGAGNDSVMSGAGNDSVLSGVGNDSVDAGEGYDQVQMSNGGGADNYSFEVVDGEVVVTDVSGEITTVSNAEYIDLGEGAAIINTKDTEDGTAARQSEAILGRQMTADELEEYQQLVDEIGLDAASADLMASSGFADDTADLTDLEYINLLYNQTFGRDVDPEGRDFYLNQLSEGIIDRAKLAADLSWSDEGIDSNDLVNEIDGLV